MCTIITDTWTFTECGRTAEFDCEYCGAYVCGKHAADNGLHPHNPAHVIACTQCAPEHWLTWEQLDERGF